MNTLDAKSALREWILARNRRVRPEELKDDTPILRQRVITSLQLMDLILFLEELGAKSITIDRMRPGAFDSIDTICRAFFVSEAA